MVHASRQGLADCLTGKSFVKFEAWSFSYCHLIPWPRRMYLPIWTEAWWKFRMSKMNSQQKFPLARVHYSCGVALWHQIQHQNKYLAKSVKQTQRMENASLYSHHLLYLSIICPFSPPKGVKRQADAMHDAFLIFCCWAESLLNLCFKLLGQIITLTKSSAF